MSFTTRQVMSLADTYAYARAEGMEYNNERETKEARKDLLEAVRFLVHQHDLYKNEKEAILKEASDLFNEVRELRSKVVQLQYAVVNNGGRLN